MADRMTWNDIEDGDLVLGAKDGKEWVVSRKTGASVTLTHGDKVHNLKIADLPFNVQRIATAYEVLERAEALAQVRLGGETLARTDTPDGVPSTPDVFVDKGSLLAHIYLFHMAENVKYPDGTFGDAIAAHDAMHEREPVVPHTHDSGFYRAMARSS